MVNESGAVAGRDFVQKAEYAAGRDIHFHARERPRAGRALPRDIDHFIGRIPEIIRLEALLAPARAVSPVVIIANGPGCGKTALAIHIAHRLAERFPEAQLHVRLGGEGQPDLLPADALRHLLAQLGLVDKEIPADPADMSARYRAVLPEGSLVILDNAMSREQIEPLLPAGPGCAAIVTSRSDLAGLEGIRVLDLGPLPREEASALLRELLTADRVATDRDAADRIVDLCGALPLALRIACALLNSRARRRMPLVEFADRLDEQRLDVLKLGHTEVRASFGLSYRALSPPAARLFRLLGSVHVADVSHEFVLRLDGTADAETAVEELINAYLIEPVAEDRLRFHDLMRLFAEECATEESSDSRTEAMERACRWATERAGDPGPDWAVIVELIKQTPDDESIWRLAAGLAGFLERRGHWTDWLDSQVLAVQAAIRLGDPEAQGISLHHLAGVQRLLRRTDEALESELGALAMLRQPDEHRAAVLEHLGKIYRELHRYDDALDVLDEAAAIYRAASDRHGEGLILQTLGHVLLKRRELDAAVESLNRAAGLLHEAGDVTNEGWAHNNLISAYEAKGEHGRALAQYEITLEIFKRAGEPLGEAWAYNHAGRVHRALGHTDEQVDCHERALALFRELGDRYGSAWALLDLGVAGGDLDAMREAHAIFERINETAGRGWALSRLAEASGDASVLGPALACFQTVGDLYGQEQVRDIERRLEWNH